MRFSARYPTDHGVGTREMMGVDLDPHVLDDFSGPTGGHGVTYPDLSWEPKESFRAVAEYYEKH